MKFQLGNRVELYYANTKGFYMRFIFGISTFITFPYLSFKIINIRRLK
jgi:hypothetical protein